MAPKDIQRKVEHLYKTIAKHAEDIFKVKEELEKIKIDVEILKSKP